MRFLSLLGLAAPALLAAAQKPGTFKVMGQTKVSAMMMFLGNEKKVYILDKVEGNPTQINGHPAWAVEWDIASGNTRLLDMSTNAFCAAGMHLPNGSYAVFGGNGAIGPTGALGSQNDGFTGQFDNVYQDFDGGKTIRIMDPCDDESCNWFDNSTFFQMSTRRWYPGCEALADGSSVLVGGFANGGYINRNTPNVDPLRQGGAAIPSFEFFPSRGGEPEIMQFMGRTSGLNAYALMYLLPSGRMLVQANISTIVWDYNANVEMDLPQMPNNVARVYPASGASTLLPLTPANNYIPTAIFCGGSNMTDDQWGNYSFPIANTWEIPASNDCQRITPEPLGFTGTDYSAIQYEQDDDMLEGRTMGQFIILPDLTILLVNGGSMGTAGYATATGMTPGGLADMPFGESLATAPVFRPALYDPTKPRGQRWNNTGFDQSTVPRLYHSSALLMPDGSVMIAGSNPNIDYNISTYYPTEYRAEYFYPPYFAASVRPQPQGIPSTLTYGGQFFDLTIPPASYSGSANAAAGNTTVTIVRPGWTTHAINMGQRAMQLNNTYTVADDGTITLHVSQPPPNPNLFQPGPALFFVNVHGIPSIGKIVIVGSGKVETQPTLDAVVLPGSKLSAVDASGSADPAKTTAGTGSDTSAEASSGSSVSKGAIIAAVVGGIAGLALVGVFAGMFLARRRRQAAARETILGGVQRSASMGRAYRDKEPSMDAAAAPAVYAPIEGTIPLRDYSQADLHAPSAGMEHPYSDRTPNGSTTDFNPYTQQQQQGYAYQHQQDRRF